MSLTARDVRDMLAAYQDGTTEVGDILRYHGVSSRTLYYHLDRAGVPRRRPTVRLEVGEVVDLSLHVLQCFPVAFVARPGERPLPEASRPADSGALVASRATDSLALCRGRRNQMPIKYPEFSALVGEVLTSVEGVAPGSDEVVFRTASGRRFRLSHDQDCCESVSLAEVHGDVADLLGVPVLAAEESTNRDNPPEHAESFLWTFYRLQTIKGAVQLRWLGESNGYYSEDVSFVEVGDVR